MFPLAVIARLVAASPAGCYLVTSEGISTIPCEFSAAATDTLRYAADDSPEARAKRAAPRSREPVPPWRPPDARAFGRGRRNGAPR